MSADSMPGGEITFAVRNIDEEDHNMKIVRTTLPPDQLPLDAATMTADESSLEILASTRDLPPGSNETLSVVLDPGSYVLICNIPLHYEEGMFSPFAVE